MDTQQGTEQNTEQNTQQNTQQATEQETQQGIPQETSQGSSQTPFFIVRTSPVHGLGAFAARRIPAGAHVAEYLGERISSEEGSRRYDDDASERPHVLLFAIDENTVLDAAVGGSDAQYINHSCAPNCETEIIDGRAFVVALREIAEGEEITYDYHLDYEGEQTEEVKLKFACRCGAASCRGTMLEPPAEKMKAKKKKKKGKKEKRKDGKKEKRKDGKKAKRKDVKKGGEKDGKKEKGKDVKKGGEKEGKKEKRKGGKKDKGKDGKKGKK